jgi:hypothetical protein
MSKPRSRESAQFYAALRVLLVIFMRVIFRGYWGTYEEMYASPGNASLVIITHESAAELDAEEDNDHFCL